MLQGAFVCYCRGRIAPSPQGPARFPSPSESDAGRPIPKSSSERRQAEPDEKTLGLSFGVGPREGTASIVSLWTISSTLNSPFRVLCIFPSRYLSSIGLSLISSLGWNLPPLPRGFAFLTAKNGFSLGLQSQTARLCKARPCSRESTVRSRRHRAFTFSGATFQWDFRRESRDEAGLRQATPPWSLVLKEAPRF